MSPLRKNEWLPLYEPSAGAVTRLVCFPHAGGSAQAYGSWQQHLGPDCEVCAVQPPGRWNRYREPKVSDLAELVDSVVESFGENIGKSFALFGHSVGALVAFEFARALRRCGLPGPRRLFVSGRRAPHVQVDEPLVRTLSDHELIALVSGRFGAIPEQLLNDPGMLDVVIPILRSDLQLDQEYAYASEPPLACPISVFGGASDRTTSQASLEAWHAHTTAGLSIRIFPGGHFFLESERDAVLHTMKEYL
jgi:medium-chain acyl-[acyl-carrier-protein] hydrolase